MHSLMYYQGGFMKLVTNRDGIHNSPNFLQLICQDSILDKVELHFLYQYLKLKTLIHTMDNPL